MKNEDKPRLFPEHFKIGKFSGSPRDFTKGKISLPRGGEDILEYWYTDDPEESEYLDEDFQQNVEERIERLKREGWDPTSQIFLATTQSHLDLGWMWRFRQGVAKAERTFAKLHRHFKLFAPFTFTGSQPAQYQWVKLNSPEIWEQILMDVKNGRHEIQGGSWSEADGRMPSGEGWVRQRLYGQLFNARNFGKIANIEWFPDSFGYAYNLPQIFMKSGAEGFMTSKLVSNKQTKWPFWAWIWEAPDGSQLVSYLCGNHNKLGPLAGFDVVQRDSEIKESYVNSFHLVKPEEKLVITYEMDKPEDHPSVADDELPFIGCFFGEGDGGHGPQGIEMGVYRAFAARGYVKWASTNEIFQELKKYQERLPIWKDELYYEFHRGSLTTQTMMKRMNRYFEWHLPVVEGLHGIVSTLSPNSLTSFKTFYMGESDQIPSTDNPIEQIWQNVALMQFHDVLPGTSIPEVYDECYEFWNQDLNLLNRLKKDALSNLITLLGLDNQAIKLFNLEDVEKQIFLIPSLIVNASGARGNQIIEISKNIFNEITPIAVILNNSTNISQIHPLQLVKSEQYCFDLDRKFDRYLFHASLPAWYCELSWVVGVAKDTPLQLQNDLCKNLCVAVVDKSYAILEEESHFILLSPELQVTINRKTGSMDNLNFKEKNFLRESSGLCSFEDHPVGEKCWNLMPNWWDYPKDDFQSPPEVSIIENGPVKWTVRVSRSFGQSSTAIIDYSVCLGMSGFGLDIGLDFHETETLIKYVFPLGIDANYSIAEVPYATSIRKCTPTANHDIPRWEKWMHTFVALENTDKNIGIAVLNDGKYGFDTLNQSLGISIIHGPEYPGLNVVAWAKEERKAREKANLGKPPLYADQGENLTRLWVLPYYGTWREGEIHHRAHLFNSHSMIQPIKTPILNEIPLLSNENFSLTALNPTLKNKFNHIESHWQFLKIEPSTVEITVLKRSETLPECLLSEQDPPIKAQNGFILRVVNNIDEENDAKIQIDPILLKNATILNEVDLLERPILQGVSLKITKNDSPLNFSVSLKPHEIKTFKIYESPKH